MRLLIVALFIVLPLQGCLAVSAVRVTGDVVEGGVNAAVFTAKTITPGGDDKDDKSSDD